MIVSVFIIAAVGLCLSLYGFFVEYQIDQDPTYKPACDISDRVSCSKTFLSPYGKMLKVSNTFVGLLFYASMMILAWLGHTTLLWYGALAAVVASAAFAYILFFKVQTICLICISIYVVNIMLFIAVYINR